LYFNNKYYFDNLGGIDWDMCFEIVKIYENKALEEALKSYHKIYA